MDVERFALEESIPAAEPLPLPPQAEEQQRSLADRVRRWVAGATLAAVAVASTVAAVANPREVAIEAARSAANILYVDTPIGWAAQAFDIYEQHEAGWSNPVETTFKIYHDEKHQTPRHPLVTNFIFTGLREMHGEEIASEIAAATKYQYPTRYQENGNQPISSDSMAHQLIRSIEEHPLDTPTIGFTCHSMGGIMLVETLDRLQQMNYKLPKIAFIDFLSTPSGMQTAHFGNLGDFLTRAQIGQQASGAVVADIFSQLEAQHFQWSWLFHDINKGVSDVSQGASPALTDSQMEALDQINNLQTLIDKLMPLRGILSPDTKVTYYGPEDPSTDTVVRDIAAYKQLAYAFKLVLGIDVIYVPWGHGHADTSFPSNQAASNNLQQRMLPAAALVGSPPVDHSNS